MNYRVDKLLSDRSKFALTPEQTKHKELLDKHKDNPECLKSLLRDNPFLYMSDIEKKAMAKEKNLENKKLNEVIEELKFTLQYTLKEEEKNLKKFEQLFEMQKKHIDDVKKDMTRQNDRNLNELTDEIRGPVNKIVDKVCPIASKKSL